MSCTGCNRMGICPIKWGIILLVLGIPTGIGISCYVAWSNAAAERVAYERIMDTEWMCKENGLSLRFANDQAYFLKDEEVKSIRDVEGGANNIWEAPKVGRSTLTISWLEEGLHIGLEDSTNELTGVYREAPESFTIRLPIEGPSEIELQNNEKRKEIEAEVIRKKTETRP